MDLFNALHEALNMLLNFLKCLFRICSVMQNAINGGGSGGKVTFEFCNLVTCCSKFYFWRSDIFAAFGKYVKPLPNAIGHFFKPSNQYLEAMLHVLEELSDVILAALLKPLYLLFHARILFLHLFCLPFRVLFLSFQLALRGTLPPFQG